MSIDRDYVLNYIVNGSAAVSTLRQIKTELNLVDHETKTATASVVQFTNSLNSASLATQGINAHLTNTTGQVKQFHGALGILSFVAFESGLQLVQTFGEAIEQSRQHLKELGKEAADTRDKMRELAQLHGKTGPDDALMAEVAVAAADAGLTTDEGTKFNEQFEGAIKSGEDKGNISPEVKRGLNAEGMKFGVRTKLAPGTAGKLIGILANYGKIESVEQGMAQAQGIIDALQAGVGNTEPLVTGLLRHAGAYVAGEGSPVASLGIQAAAHGVASINADPTISGRHVNQAIEALRHFSDDEQGDALKRLDITPKDTFPQALAKLAPHVLAADKEGIGGDVWMEQQGFHAVEQRRTLLQLARNQTVVDQRVALDVEANKPGKGAGVVQRNEDFLLKTQAGRHRRVAAAQKARQLLTGMGQEKLNDYRQTGADLLHNEGWVGPLNTAREAAANLTTLFGVFKTQGQKESEDRYVFELAREGQRVGVDILARYDQTRKHPDALRGGRRGYLAMITHQKDPKQQQAVREDFWRRGDLFDADKGKFIEQMTREVENAGGDPTRNLRAQIARKFHGKADQANAEDAESVTGTINAQAAKVGIDVPAAWTRVNNIDPSWRGLATPGAQFATAGGDFIQSIVANVRAKGGDPFAGNKAIESKFDQLLKLTQDANAARDRAARAPLAPGAGGVEPGRAP